jgi:hypothetical protein
LTAPKTLSSAPLPGAAAVVQALPRDRLDRMRISLSREVKLAIFLTIVALISLGVCGQYAFAPEAKEALPPSATLAQLTQAPEPPPEPTPAADAPDTATPTPAAQVDSYAGWESWCEPMHYETECETSADCVGIEHVSGRNDALKCLHPWWAPSSSELKICNPGGSSKLEREWRKARLRELVSQLYFDEPEHCEWGWERDRREFKRVWSNGKQTHGQHWRCQREWRLAEKLTKFLLVPYGRETSKRPFKRHRLDPDAAANEQAWVKEASAYGWVVELACEVEGRSVGKCPRIRKGPKKGKKRIYIKDAYPDPDAESHNPYYDERYRWYYGLGPVGKNTGYGVQDWDRMAPPEILCLEVPGFESYMRDVRGAVRVYRGGRPPVCDGEPYRGHAIKILKDGTELEVDEPSWRDVHRVASAGAWCPKKGAKAEKMRKRFNRDMARVGLRPEEPVTEASVGHGIPREGQWQRAQEVMVLLDELLPSPWG